MKLRNSEILTLLMLVAPTALMLQSCCCHVRETVDEEEHIEQPSIMMGVASAGTKAVIDGSDANARLANMVGQCFTGTPATLKQNAGFGVYSYKSIADKSTILFDNTQVYPDPAQYNTDNPASTPWTYSPTRFWDMTASYQFIAYWPYLPNTTGASPYVSVPSPENPNAVKESEKVLTIHNIPNWQPANTGDDPDDYMIATSSGSYQSKYASTNGMVHLSFRHILSQLVIKAYYTGSDLESNSGLGVTVHSITIRKSDSNEQVLSNISNGNTVNVTDFSQKYNDKDAAPLAPISPLTNMADVCTLDLASQGVRIPYMDELTKVFTLADSNPSEPKEVGRWLFVPHKWLKLNLSVNRTIGNSTADSAPVPVTIGESNYNYNTQPGNTYIITLMIDAATGGITIGSVDIQNWIEQNTTYEVYNW